MAARARLALSCLFALAMLVGPFPAARPAHAATFAVNSTLDEPDANLADGLCLSTPSNVCTLRAAIQQSRGATNNTITLPAGTFTLTRAGQNEDLAVTGDLDIAMFAVTFLAITGAGANSTIIDGAGLDRVFDVSGGGAVTMSDLRIRGGAVPAGNAGGGGIRNQGILTLQRVSVANNSAAEGGGIFNSANANLTLDASVLDTNVGGFVGGGIRNDGSLTLRNGAAAVNNIAFNGGGIFNQGSLTGTDVFTASNVANNGQGGGILSSADTLTLNRFSILSNQASGQAQSTGGLAVFTGIGTATLTNGSIFQNSGAIGGLFVDGATTLNNVTLVSNTGTGIAGGITTSGGTVTVRNSIVANNSAPNCAAAGGQLDSDGHNLDSGNTCGFILFRGDLRNTNPQLGGLFNNGLTLTQTILSGSPAVDAGSPATPGTGGNSCDATDQRNQARPRPGIIRRPAICDIGAFETAPVPANLGTFEVSPSEGGVGPNEQITYRYTWTVPAPRNWHELNDLQIRWVGDQGTVLHIRWHEGSDGFNLIRAEGASFVESRSQGSGPTGQSVTLTLGVKFDPSLDGKTLVVEVSATDDSGATQEFERAGTLGIGNAAPGAGAGRSDSDPKERKPSELELQERQRTNRAGLDEYRTEGNVVATACEQEIPEVVIANRDSLVTIRLLYDTRTQCKTIQPGDYLEISGVKEHEYLFHAESVTIKRGGQRVR